MSVQNLKNFDANRLSTEELVSLSAEGRALRAEYEALKVDEPEWVSVQINALRREVQSREADSRDARKRTIKAQLEGLKTPKERSAALRKELEELESVSK